MMTEMTRYKQQNDVDEDETSLGSATTEEIATGTTQIRYHMGSHFWRSRTNLEKFLLVGCGLLIISIIVLFNLLGYYQAQHGKDSSYVLLHNHETVLGPCLSEDCVKIAGKILERMNMSVDPCEDFYQYSCGEWIASSVKPEGKPSWGTLIKINADNQVIIKRALESTDVSESEAEEKAKRLYRSCRDFNRTIETRGAEPLKNLIKDAGGWTLSGDWSPDDYDLQSDIIRSTINYHSGALFSWGCAENVKQSDSYVLEFDQGGLGLPARNYYLNESEEAIREAYVKYIAKVGVLLGAEENESKKMAEDILKFEVSLAEVSDPDDKRRDMNSLYHNMTIQDLTELAPFLDWLYFLNSAYKMVNQALTADRVVVVYAPLYLKELNNILINLSKTEEGNTTIHNYLTWHIVKNFIPFLSKNFREAFSILEKAQFGVSGFEEEWRECVSVVGNAFGDASGAMYIRSAFSKDSKNKALAMLSRIRETFRLNLSSVSWMDLQTKLAALKKADAITQMIGYPDFIIDPNKLDKKYEELEITEDKFFESTLNVTQFKFKESLEKLFKTVNKSQWDMTASTVNAYYSPTKNSIVFPAGILQPPLFDNKNPASLNYGAVGVIMGHELSHAFDDQGRKYDKNGNLEEWWETETRDKFNLRTKCMIDQYSKYSLKDEHIDGNRTLGENIADNGGLKVSFQAFKIWEEKEESPKILPGLNLTPDQLFFLGFSQIWCSTMTKEVAHLEILRDPHVLPQFRVLGTLSNSQEFADAFKCKVGSRMNPKLKCKVW